MRPSVEFRNASAISDFPPHTVGIREQVADVRQIPKNGERHLFESEVETINTSELTPIEEENMGTVVNRPVL